MAFSNALTLSTNPTAQLTNDQLFFKIYCFLTYKTSFTPTFQ